MNSQSINEIFDGEFTICQKSGDSFRKKLYNLKGLEEVIYLVIFDKWGKFRETTKKSLNSQNLQ